VVHWQADGDVRAWDLTTGKLIATFRHDPPRGVGGMVLSPDGSSFAAFEQPSGALENGRNRRAASLWDANSGKFRPLPADLQYWAVYSADGKTLAAPAQSDDRQTSLVRLIDVASAKEKLTIPIGEKGASLGYIAVSPDGKLLAGQVRGKAGHALRLWEVDTGRQVASFAGEKDDLFLWMSFSPDGRTLAVTNSSRPEQGKLFLFDVPGRKPAKKVVFGKKVSVFRRPAFSPDGKWIAVATQVFPDDPRAAEKPEELPQPRIHLIEAASGEVRETIVAPQGVPLSLCFSPDGKTLATAGNGRVLLWDLARPPLGDGTRRE
jgi:dipeptidyl aminopeptidase/acylaminoacyl peptidase